MTRCYVWGAAGQGQLGRKHLHRCCGTPLAVERQGEAVVAVACGEAHSLFLTAFGEVLSCGRSREGQLGRPTTDDPLDRVVGGGFEGESVVGVACGANSSIACTARGRVFEWGLCCAEKAEGDVQNAQELATLAGAAPAEELRVRSADPILRRIVASSTERYQMGDLYVHADAPREDDPDHLARTNQFSQEERDATIGLARMDFRRVAIATPRLAKSLAGVTIVQVSAGYGHSLARSRAGALYTAGYNDRGQCGLGHRINLGHFEKTKLADVTFCSAGGQHSLAVVAGDLFAFGQGALGQLGLGRRVTGRLVPVKVKFEGNRRMTSCGAGYHHSVALDETGVAWFFGHAEYGQHGGLGALATHDYVDAEFYCVPREIKQIDRPLKSVSCGANFSMGVDYDGAVVTWGWPAHGVLGRGDAAFGSASPEVIPALGGAKNGLASAVCCAAGGRHAAAVLTDHTSDLYAEGFRGLLGDATGDVTLVVEDAEFKAHAAVLCARSKYFDAMLRAAGSETTLELPTRVVEGARLTGPMLHAVLVYLYCDRVEAPPHRLRQLAAVARAWLLPALADLCDLRFGSNIKPPKSTFAGDMAAAVLEEAVLEEAGMSAAVLPHRRHDVSVAVGETRFWAHKLILKRSDFFAAALRFAEAQGKDTLEMDLAESEARVLLRFVYGGAATLEVEAEEDAERLMALIVAADLVNLPSLVRICEHALIALIGDDHANAEAVYDFAQRFAEGGSCQRLRRAAEAVLGRDES